MPITPIHYGRRLTLEHNGEVLTATEEVFANYQSAKRVVVETESVTLNSDEDILPHFLTMLDRMKAGEVDCIGIQLLRNGKTGAPRIEKTWTVPE